MVKELIDFLAEEIDELGSRKEVEHALTILQRGTSADRQVAIHKETGDAKAVVDWLVDETVKDSQLN